MSNQFYDVAIIGSGPSGIAAALELSNHNLKILLIDNNERVGGQIYRASPSEFKPDESIEETRIQQQFEVQIKNSNIDYKPNHTVWQISEQFRIDAFNENETLVWFAKKIIVATGTTERIVPFDGWTNPGVIGLAASTIILKSQQSLPGKKIIVAGCGPLLLVVAYYTLKLGGKIEAIIDTNSKWKWFKNFFYLLSNVKLFTNGIKWIVKILLSKIPIYSNYSVTKASPSHAGMDIEIKKIDNLKSGQTITLNCDTLCIGHGLIPSTDFSRLVNAKHIFDQTKGGWIPVVNSFYETSVENFYQIGDASGVLGAMPAYEKGTIAALSILNKLGLLNEESFNNKSKKVLQKLNKYEIFGKAIASISFPPNQLINQINDKTIICRCEDITKAEIENAVKHGAKDLNQLKTWTRCGMGPCQGRTCNYAASIVMSESLQQKIEKMGYWTGRAPVRPIPFDVAVGNFEYDQITKIESAPL